MSDKPKRSIFGKIVSFVFWSFQAVALLFIIAIFTGADRQPELLIALPFIGGIWFFGTVILGFMGLMTRPR